MTPAADLEVDHALQPRSSATTDQPSAARVPSEIERVHRGRAVAQVGRGRAVQRPRAPDDGGRGEHERDPLPVGELQRRDHRQRDHRHGQRRDDEEAVAQGPARVGFRWRRRGQRGRVARRLDLRDERGRVEPVGVADVRLLGGVVDGGDDAVELVELALDAVGARRAGHAADGQVDLRWSWVPRRHGELGRVHDIGHAELQEEAIGPGARDVGGERDRGARAVGRARGRRRSRRRWRCRRDRPRGARRACRTRRGRAAGR